MPAYVKLQRIFCRRTEDTLNDEAYLRLNGTKVWGPVSVDDDSTTEINLLVEFAGQATVDLFDEDLGNFLDEDDFLGRHVVTELEVGMGDRHVRYTGDDADYTLFYKVAVLDI
jgi:hypothetical protein